jgi:hypothetical protein
MPRLTWSQSVAAGATYRPLDGWQYEYVPMGGIVKYLTDATAAGVVATITSGSDTLQERAPVSAGGTAGVLPSPLDVPEQTDEVAAGDRQKIQYENTTGGAITVNGSCEYIPA